MRSKACRQNRLHKDRPSSKAAPRNFPLSARRGESLLEGDSCSLSLKKDPITKFQARCNDSENKRGLVQ